MPELPEVETIVRGLSACLPGRRIEQVMLSAAAAARILRTPVEQFARALTGARVAEVRRHGKHILLRMERPDDGAQVAWASSPQRPSASETPALHHGRQDASATHFWWIVHLGMTGQLICEPPGRELPRHTHAWFELDAGQERPGAPTGKNAYPAAGSNVCPTVLRYTDIRQFGRMEIVALLEETPGASPLPARLEELGPDPLAIGVAEFARRLRARKARVKALLLDQRFLRGLGNIYADESLFRARLHPAASARRISPERAAALWRAVRAVLRQAIAHGGSSISNYRDASGEAGAYQRRHQVYGRAGEPCLRCGARLRRALVAGRGTTYCPHCQRK